MLTRTPVLAACLLATGLLAACRNGDPAPPPPPPPAPVTVDIADVAVAEGDGGATDAIFDVTLSAAASADISVNYATADGSATAGSDYMDAQGTLTIPAGATQGSIAVSVTGDTDFESDETFSVTLSGPSASAVLGNAIATGHISNDDAPPMSPETGLNDTGILRCSTEIADDFDCNDASVGTDDFPRQDAEYGRDFTANDDGDGRAGFALLKLDDSGALLADQSADFLTTPWDCVEDAVTGLVWEAKADDAASLRDAAASYSWRNSSGINDGGDPGVIDGGNCPVAGECDTEAFVAAINAAALCGKTNWRLPGRSDLLSLVDYAAAGGPTIDTGYFPNAVAALYWSADPDGRGDVRSVDFSNGESRDGARSATLHVRLVSGGSVQ